MSAPWRFPVVALAISARQVGFVAATGPMQVNEAKAWALRKVAADERRQFVKHRILQVVEKYEPETILVTHGTRWKMDRKLRAVCLAAAKELELQITFLDLDDACRFMECGRSLRAAALRISDSYPKCERHVRATVRSVNASAARETRAILSALAAVHAASVRHLIKFG
jgi:hypothetical protein